MIGDDQAFFEAEGPTEPKHCLSDVWYANSGITTTCGIERFFSIARRMSVSAGTERELDCILQIYFLLHRGKCPLKGCRMVSPFTAL